MLGSKSWAWRAAIVLLLGLCAPIGLRADGGTLQVRRQAGPWLVTVFTSPALPRAGIIDFTVLLQDPASLEPVLDAEVEIRASDERGTTVSRGARHDAAQNRLFYGALLTLHEGEWGYEIAVKDGSAQPKNQATARGSLQVFAPSEPRLASHWHELALAPLLLLLFGFHQWLALSAKRRGATLRYRT
jgi:hypothetical protein